MDTKQAKPAGMIESVRKQFEKAADVMNLNPNIRKILAQTNNEIVVHFPVKMDNGDVEILENEITFDCDT